MEEIADALPAQVRLSQGLVYDDLVAILQALGEGACANAVDWAGWTPLHACRSPAAAQALLAAGADPSTPDTAGRLPVEAALASGRRSLAWLLFDVASEAARRARGPWLLRLASASPSARIVDALLAQGVSPDVADGQGRTPLLRLWQGPHALTPEGERVARALLSAGASWDARDRHGHTPRKVLEGHLTVSMLHRLGSVMKTAWRRFAGVREGSQNARLRRLLALAPPASVSAANDAVIDEVMAPGRSPL